MATRWVLNFKALRSGGIYHVNIHDDNWSGRPAELIGSDVPFDIQEDNDEDMFLSVRKQTGYLRIINNGLINWRTIIPSTDIDRPVTLYDNSGNLRWCGFMQAQNFGVDLYGTPQEIRFPLQCPLSVMSTREVSAYTTSMDNFATYIKFAVDAIPLVCRPDTFIFQGGSDALAWLKMQVDPLNYVEKAEPKTSTDPLAKSSADFGEVFQDICDFWGWTARIQGKTLYFVCPDDNTLTDALVLTYNELVRVANGHDEGTVETMYNATQTIGNIFASSSNKDYQLRGPNTAKVTSNSNSFDDDVMMFDEETIEKEEAQGWQSLITDGDNKATITNDLMSFDSFCMSGSATANKASFNAANYQFGQTIEGEADQTYSPLIRIKSVYDGTVFASLETRYEHCYHHNFVELSASIYQKATEFEDEEEHWQDQQTMYIQFGIGITPQSARWLTGYYGTLSSYAWSDTPSPVKVCIGRKDKILRFFIYTSAGHNDFSIDRYLKIDEALSGFLFINFLGASNMPSHAGSTNFDICDFKAKIYHSRKMEVRYGRWVSGTLPIKDKKSSREYEAKAEYIVKSEWTRNNNFASDNDMDMGSALVVNANNTFFRGYQYPGETELQYPEQRLADRVVNYWATSKREILCDLLAHDGSAATLADTISPRDRVIIDGSTMYPISIERNWRDDLVRLTLIEINVPEEEEEEDE